MTTSPSNDGSDNTVPDNSAPDQADENVEDGPGAEIGMTEGEGSTFEPEEDPEGHQ